MSDQSSNPKAPRGQTVVGDIRPHHPAVHAAGKDRYRVWIFAAGGCPTNDSQIVAPDATALEAAERGTMSARQAARYVETFNKTVQSTAARVRAVALPVAVRYEGEPRAGQTLRECVALRQVSTVT